jgi:catechol-2,3-dioxygenase
MILNHINLTVSDAQETATFLEKYFGLTPMPGLAHSKTFAILRDSQGMILTLIRGKRDVEVTYPATFHIGFAQASREAVDEVNRRLREDGFTVAAPAELHGSYTFYFRAPGNFEIEVLSE